MTERTKAFLLYLSVALPLGVVFIWLLKQVPQLGNNEYFTTLPAVLVAITIAHWVRKRVFGEHGLGEGK